MLQAAIGGCDGKGQQRYRLVGKQEGEGRFGGFHDGGEEGCEEDFCWVRFLHYGHGVEVGNSRLLCKGHREM